MITVEPVNDSPVARDDAAHTTRNERVSIDVLANDSDPEGDPLAVVSTSAPTVGRARVDGQGIRLVATARIRRHGVLSLHRHRRPRHGGRTRSDSCHETNPTVPHRHGSGGPAADVDCIRGRLRGQLGGRHPASPSTSPSLATADQHQQPSSRGR